MAKLNILVLFVAYVGYTIATNGVDVSTAVSTSAWTCLKEAGYSFAIVRVYKSTGRIDPNGAQTISNARSAGIPYVDGYIFPCQKCGDPKGQVRSTVDYLKQMNANFGQLWLDIEGTQYWSSNKDDNVRFIQDMVDEASDLGVTVGIYTSASQWNPITGNNVNFGNLQLWYAHYDNQPNFSDFKPFGGWRIPAMKQYVGDTSICGVGIDKNWYP